MKKALCLVAALAVSLFAAGILHAQQAAPPSQEQVKQKVAAIQEQIKQENLKLLDIYKKLDINNDAEVKSLRAQQQALNAKVGAKVREKASKDPAGAASYAKIDKLNDELKKLLTPATPPQPAPKAAAPAPQKAKPAAK